jgi:hypothetical protein
MPPPVAPAPTVTIEQGSVGEVAGVRVALVSTDAEVSQATGVEHRFASIVVDVGGKAEQRRLVREGSTFDVGAAQVAVVAIDHPVAPGARGHVTLTVK